MSELTREDIVQILTFFGESSFVQLHLEMGNIKLSISKKEITGSALEGESSSLERVHSTTAVKPIRPDKNQGLIDEKKLVLFDSGVEQVKQDGVSSEEATCIAIRSPMVGTFYRSPRPGAPPFVDVGTSVAEGDTICIIEVMKTMNTVKPNVRGTIFKICAENGQMVEYNQTLFLVRPENGSGIGSQKASEG
jgi:acetyl-CoA carboxylase biotin carboxyl carrier protein